jgi:perosamine synthetase
MSIPIARPTLRRRDFNSVLSCLVSDLIGPGALNQELGSLFCREVDAAGGVCLTSYAAAIGCVLDALGLQAGEAVMLSALAPRVYLSVLEARGLVPTLLDTDREKPALPLSEVQKQLAGGARALLLHYSLGFLPDSQELFRLGLPVVEDVSQVLGGRWEGRPCGSFGEAGVASLGPEGMVTAGCGAVAFARDRRLLKNLQASSEKLSPEALLPDMNAALAIAQLKDLPRFLQRRGEIAAIYQQSVQRSRHGTFYSEEGLPVHFGFPVVLSEGLREARQYAQKKGVQTAPAFADAIIATAGSAAEGERQGDLSGCCPNARDLCWRSLLFPLFPSLTRREVQLVAKVLSTLP